MCVYFTFILGSDTNISYLFLDEDRHGTTREKHEGDGNFRQVFFGRLVRSSERLQEFLVDFFFVPSM